MADISMCMNRECPLRSDCFRYRAKPWSRQSYGGFRPNANGVCGDFVAISPDQTANSVEEVDSKITSWEKRPVAALGGSR